MHRFAMQTEKQAHLASSLDKLMSEVQRNLEPKNRDKFTQVGTQGPPALFQEVKCLL